MNRENVLKVRDAIAAAPDRDFNMANWRQGHSCGTAQCIGGWAETLSVNEGFLGSGDDVARDYLGLTQPQAEELFCPDNYYRSFAYTKAKALDTLTRLAETGDVKWDVTDEEVYA